MAIRIVKKDTRELFDNARKTYLSASVAAAATTLTVRSIKEFAIDQVLCIGEPGNENSEIVKTHASTAPSASTITLAAGVTYAHPIDTPVYWIDYDQVEFSHAATVAGSKSVLATENIEADAQETIHKESTQTDGFFFTRYKNSIGTTYSDYSDGEPYAGYDEDTVFAIKDRAMEEMGLEFNDKITSEWLNKRLWQARRIVHNKIKRWSWRQSFNTDLGNVVAGDYRVAMPTDIKDPNTNKDVMGFRIGTTDNLKYVTKKEIDMDWQGVSRTTLGSAYTTADGTITLTDSRDFPESGTLEFPDGDTVEYSANAESTGVLTVSTAGSSNHSDEALVYANVSFTLPTKYTIWNGYIYFNYPIDEDYEDENYWIDYYKMLTEYDTDGDELDEPEFDFYVNYLKWAIKGKQSEGQVGVEDKDYQLFMLGLSDLVRKETSGQEINLIPDCDYGDDD
jgi:hypothetical protein